MAERDDILAAIPRLQIMRDVPAERCAALAALFHVRLKRCPAGAAVFQSGASAAIFGVLLRGRVQSVHYDFLGNRFIITEHHGAESFGLGSVGGTRAYDYIAAEASDVLLFDMTDVFSDTSPYPAADRLLAARLVHSETARQSRRYEQHISAMQGKTLRDKLMIFLTDRIQERGTNDFSIDFSRQELADYLGVDRSSLCREIAAMRRQGLLVCRGKHFRILSDFESTF